MTILVDSSVWIDLFRARPSVASAKLESSLGQREILIGDLILTEILQGLRGEHESRQVEQAFAAFPVVPLVGESIARKSAKNFRRLRQRGLTVRKTIDCLIATWCIEHDVALLHSDRDFEAFRSLGLREL